MKTPKMYKIDKVREHLIFKGSITSWEAITLYGATRLAAYIHTFRERGMDITTERISDKDRNGNSTTFANYVLNNRERYFKVDYTEEKGA